MATSPSTLHHQSTTTILTATIAQGRLLWSASKKTECYNIYLSTTKRAIALLAGSPFALTFQTALDNATTSLKDEDHPQPDPVKGCVVLRKAFNQYLIHHRPPQPTREEKQGRSQQAERLVQLELNPKDLTPLKGHRFKVLGTGVQAAVRIQSMLGPTSGPTLGPTLLVEAENAASKFGDTPNSGVVLKHVTLSKRVPSMNASQFATELLHPTSHVAKGAVEGTKEPDQPPPGVPTTPTTSSLYVEISLNRAVTLPSHITTHGHYSPLFSFLFFSMVLVFRQTLLQNTDMVLSPRRAVLSDAQHFVASLSRTVMNTVRLQVEVHLNKVRCCGWLFTPRLWVLGTYSPVTPRCCCSPQVLQTVAALVRHYPNDLDINYHCCLIVFELSFNSTSARKLILQDYQGIELLTGCVLRFPSVADGGGGGGGGALVVGEREERGEQKEQKERGERGERGLQEEQQQEEPSVASLLTCFDLHDVALNALGLLASHDQHTKQHMGNEQDGDGLLACLHSIKTQFQHGDQNTLLTLCVALDLLQSLTQEPRNAKRFVAGEEELGTGTLFGSQSFTPV